VLLDVGADERERGDFLPAIAAAIDVTIGAADGILLQETVDVRCERFGIEARANCLHASIGNERVVTGLRASLLGHLDSSRNAEVASIDELDALLERHLDEARAAWPTVLLDDETYLAHLAEKICDRATEPARRVLETMPAADLYLAAACALGDAAAVAAFRESLLPALRQALAKLGAPPATIDEAEQRILVMLFVADRGRPQIAGYGGRGRLRSWLRSIGVRTARRLMGALHGDAGDADDLERLASAVEDPELEVLRDRYREQVRIAFAGALAALSDRERNLLRQYHIDGLTIDQLGALYRVNRGTAARWVVAARSAVLDGTRQRLTSELGVSTGEVDSIIRLVRSQLDISLRDLES
jgi:RNA polymerase sigma-70 factor, ECF subfamily